MGMALDMNVLLDKARKQEEALREEAKVEAEEIDDS